MGLYHPFSFEAFENLPDSEWQKLLRQIPLTLLIPSYFGHFIPRGGHLDPLLSHQHLVVQMSNFARY